MRRRGKVDDNHKEIVDALRANGWTVGSLASLGGGWPDLLARRPCAQCESAGGVRALRCPDDEWKLIEVKDGSKSPSRQRLTGDEIYFHSLWPVTIISSVEDVVNL